MDRKTFVLLRKRTYRHAVKYFVKQGDSKIDQRTANFTTEHKVTEKERNRNARLVAAEFSTTDEIVYDALLRSRAYGKTFILEGDEELKLQREPFDITALDSKKAALRNLFDYIGLAFDGKKDIKVLESEYRIHASAITGNKIEKGTATNIAHTPVDLKKQLSDLAETARETYKEKYGEEVPEEFNNNLAFLSALSDPDFDAKAYMDKAKQTEDVPAETIPDGPVDEELPAEDNLETLREKYFEKFGANVANSKKNDAAWIKAKLEEPDK